MQELSYWHNPGQEPLTPHTLGKLLDIATERWSDREGLVSVYEGCRYTFEETRDKAENMAAGLLQIGLQPGDRVGIWGRNSISWYIAYLASARAGLITVKLNPAYQPPELLYCLKKVDVKALICAENCGPRSSYEMISEIIPELAECAEDDVEFQSSDVPSLSILIIISEQKFPGAYRFQDVEECGTPESLDKVQEIQSRIQPSDGCDILFTSGTTGHAKGALLSHHNIVNNAIALGRRLCISDQQHRWCVCTQFCHTSASCVGIITSLSYGATLVIPGPEFNAEEVLFAIRDENCTIVMATPSQYISMILAIGDDPDLVPSTVEVAGFGGAPSSPTLVNDILNIIRPARICAAFGMTETGPITFQSLSTDSPEQIANTVGCVSEYLEAKVVDLEGRIVPLGTPGELWLRGYAIMLGYWGQEDKTRETVTPDGWLKTGDQFVLQEDGYGRIVGRLKDMIIRDNINIFPIEIEDFLSSHSDIVEVQAFGVPDPLMGEELCAYIRPREGAELTEDEIREFCKGKLADFRIPRYIRFTTDFPRTGIGKVKKFQLRQTALQELDLCNDDC